MTEPRSGHTATLLGAADGVQSGHVLIIGGDGTADLYNPSAETFARIGSLLPYMRPSYRHTASLLNDGTVLVAGGYNYLNLSCGEVQSAENAAALFAPESDGFTATTRTLNRGRDAHTATVLEDGRVLVVGGIYQTFTQSCVTNFVLDEAELFQTGTGPALTGSCLGTQFLGYGCPRVQDSTQCPGGTLAIAPTAVRCTFLNPGYVDTARGCRARTSTGQTISGYCQIRYY
jgi:hypothetical protein